MTALLVTKLYIPRLRSTVVRRASLLTTLDSGLERKLILVAAAAGSGKTTLLADWCSDHTDCVCWLSLDDGDNDPARFLSYLMAAIQTRRPQVAQELFAALQLPNPPSVETALQILINQIAQERLILVLDDYHVIENQAIHTGLAFFLEYLPPQMTLVLLTRTDPPLPLARLRARNELLELRITALRFLPEETALFLNQIMQHDLSTEDILALHNRTEGWIAGLQLASLAMQSLQGDKHSFIQDFTGSHRFVLDYLVEEVLTRQPENVRQFLLQTSILSRLNGDLCSVVTGNPDGQQMIDTLEKHNLFLIPLDQSRYWYRYHHLFADLLQARLHAESLSIVGELHQRAARWHEQNGFPEEAVAYTLAAKDFEYAATLLVGPAIQVMRRSEVMTLLNWYRAFPPDFVSHHSRLSLQFGLAFALNGRWYEAETLLNNVKNDVPPGEALLLAYLVASYRQDSRWIDEIAASAANARPDRITKLVLALLHSLKGEFHQACQFMAEVQEASEREGDVATALAALFHRCRLHVFLGELHQAYELSQQALQHVQDTPPMATLAHTALGRILIEWNDLDGAEKYLLQAIRLSELTGFVTGIISSATIMLAEVKQARGDVEGAIQDAQTALALAERNDPPSELAWLKTYQARLWLIQGNLAAALEWASSVQPLAVSLFYPNNIHKVTRARVLLAQRKTGEAISVLTRLLEEPRNLLTVEILGLLALARQTQGDSVHALLTLEQALNLAESENRIQVFVDMGSQMAKLLSRFLESHPKHEFAKKLLAAFPAPPESAKPIDSLSERELEILRLIVAGYSNEEIARTLTLALSTVKWYINILYSKLHVKTRSQAIARTHELKLL